MKDVRALPSDADPVRAEPSLSTDDAREIRRRVMDAVVAQPVRSRSWPRAAAIAALLVLMIGAGAVVVRRGIPAVSSRSQPVLASDSPEPAERRQVQFATPGGTRIIWTINPDFGADEVLK